MSRNPRRRRFSEVSGLVTHDYWEQHFLDPKTPLIIRHTINFIGSEEKNASLNRDIDHKTS